MNRIKTARLLCVFLIWIVIKSCTSESPHTQNAVELPYDSVVVLQETIVLPDFIFGDLSNIERASNGDLLIADQSSRRTWLYLNDEDDWKELVLEDCHPGIETLIIGAAFSDEHIFLTNSPSLTGHSFNRDGSCGVSFPASFRVPDYFVGLYDGFLGISFPLQYDNPIIKRYNSAGETVWKTSFENHPNPIFSSRVMGGGMAVTDDGLAYITSSFSPELHILDISTGRFGDSRSGLFEEQFEGVSSNFDTELFEENVLMWLSQAGPHMIISGFGISNQNYAFFAAPTMMGGEDADSFYLIYRLSDGAEFYTVAPRKHHLGLISGEYIYEINHLENHMELHVFGINENGIPE